MILNILTEEWLTKDMRELLHYPAKSLAIHPKAFEMIWDPPNPVSAQWVTLTGYAVYDWRTAFRGGGCE